MMNNTVAIVGTHSQTRLLVPYDDPGVDIWVFNESATDAPDGERWVKRCDAVFQMHDPMIFESLHNISDPKHYKWLREPHDFPIFMQEINSEIPASTYYPINSICSELLDNFTQGLEQKHRKLFSSSMDYAIALAIFQYRKVIKVYGVECEADTEYQRQREGIKFWTGLALGKGLKVEFYSGDAFWDRPAYGYAGKVYQDIEEYKTREKELNKSIKPKKNELVIAERAYLKSASNGTMAIKLSDLLLLNIELGYLEGRLDVNKQYQKYIQDGITLIDPTEFEIAANNAAREFQKAEIKVHQSDGVLKVLFPAWNATKDPTVLARIRATGQEQLGSGYISGYLGGMKDENIRLGAITLDRMDAAGGKKAMEMLFGDN